MTFASNMLRHLLTRIPYWATILLVLFFIPRKLMGKIVNQDLRFMHDRDYYHVLVRSSKLPTIMYVLFTLVVSTAYELFIGSHKKG